MSRTNRLQAVILTVFASVFSVFPAFASGAEPPAAPTMSGYLDDVGTVFTWLLNQITELITFILGNPFLAVSLVLFMCGAVISFFIRIKNS